MAVLTDVSITFHTHNDDKNDSTVLHVFVKNRSANSQTPESNTDFISNWLALQRYLDPATGDLNDLDRNPYLAYGVHLAPGVTFDDPGTNTFSLTLSSDSIDARDIVLPVVNVHILTDDADRWIFDYTVTFTFDDTSAFSYSSKDNGGIDGIILDQDNHNHSGICWENPFAEVEPLDVPVTDAVLKKVTIEFATSQDNKNSGTGINIDIYNRLSKTERQEIAIGRNLFKGQEFPDQGSSLASRYSSYSWLADDGALAANPIRLADMVLPAVYIEIDTGGDDDRWTFDYQVTLEFANPADFNQKRQLYSWRTSGIVLDQDNRNYLGVYQGRPFPTFTPATAPVLTAQSDASRARSKQIPVAFLQAKFAEFINNRNGANASDNPPLKKVRLDNCGPTNGGNRETYADLKAIDAPHTHFLPGQPKVTYVSAPRSLGQIEQMAGLGDLYLQDINSKQLQLTVDPTNQDAPFSLTIVFETEGPTESIGGSSGSTAEMDITNLEIALDLTLAVKTTTSEVGTTQTVIDTMAWVDQMAGADDDTQSALKDKYIRVSVTTSSALDPGGYFRQGVRDAIYDALTKQDVITKRTGRDGINSQVSSWLTGGVADDDRNTDGNNILIDTVTIDDQDLTITYTTPAQIFVAEQPADWPTGHDFSPGNLANIDHIVVLMMENRSFDHMLGYLSLPTRAGGMGRSDVDGLKGGESNSYLGANYPSYPLSDTLFAPDPPHGREPVAHAINGGHMNGFASSFGQAHGRPIAGKIMGHQTAATVPSYDALARDFTIGHRWFASHPGPTFCNRFYLLTGRLNLDARGFWEFDNSSPILPVFTPTIFDYLSDPAHSDSGEPISWAYFEHGYCTLRFYERYTFDNTHIFTADDPEYGFFARAAAGTLPSVSFIDPHFVEYPPDANCDGPPADVADGQQFVRKVVEALVASPAWNKTMLVSVYDEHGGFYDHVPPPPAPAVSPDLPINTLGVRVPVFVISPWVQAGGVFGYDSPVAGGGGGVATTGVRAAARIVSPVQGLHFDHTSILKTIARRFMSNNPPYMGARYAAANDLSTVIGSERRQPQFLPFVRYNLEFTSSQMMLDVESGNPAPQTPLWQFMRNPSPAQDFAFEDAGDGYIYIRSNVSNLYVTVDAGLHESSLAMPAAMAAPTPAAPSGPRAGITPAAGARAVAEGTAVAATGAAPAAASGPGLIQDVKYQEPHGVGAIVAGRPQPSWQKWRLTSVSPAVIQRDLFQITNEAFPGKVLRPADPTQPRSPVVLGDPTPGAGPLHMHDVWKVTTPLVNDQPIMEA
jgi:phospholipase C